MIQKYKKLKDILSGGGDIFNKGENSSNNCSHGAARFKDLKKHK